MTDDNAHAQGILAQLRDNAADEDMPDDLRERSAERADEIEAELDGDGGDGS